MAELQGDNITNSAGTGAPTFPEGVNNIGDATGAAASAGTIGEILKQITSTSGTVSGVTITAASLSITAGTWLVWATVSMDTSVGGNNDDGEFTFTTDFAGNANAGNAGTDRAFWAINAKHGHACLPFTINQAAEDVWYIRSAGTAASGTISTRGNIIALRIA